MPKPSATFTVNTSEFLILFHRNKGDHIGTPLDSYSRFAHREQAEAQCAAQMAERSVEQKIAGVFFSVLERQLRYPLPPIAAKTNTVNLTLTRNTSTRPVRRGFRAGTNSSRAV